MKRTIALLALTMAVCFHASAAPKDIFEKLKAGAEATEKKESEDRENELLSAKRNRVLEKIRYNSQLVQKAVDSYLKSTSETNVLVTLDEAEMNQSVKTMGWTELLSGPQGNRSIIYAETDRMACKVRAVHPRYRDQETGENRTSFSVLQVVLTCLSKEGSKRVQMSDLQVLVQLSPGPMKTIGEYRVVPHIEGYGL